MSNTKTQSLTAEEILNRILNAKGQFVKAVWKSNPTPAATFKKEGIILEKHTSAVCRAGINFANLSSVKEGIEEGTRGEVQSLPWGNWLHFPYIIEHTTKDGTYNEYVRLYPVDNNHSETIYFVNGEKVAKDDFVTYLTPSDANKMTSGEKIECFTVKKDNILSTEDFGE